MTKIPIKFPKNPTRTQTGKFGTLPAHLRTQLYLPHVSAKVIGLLSKYLHVSKIVLSVISDKKCQSGCAVYSTEKISSIKSDLDSQELEELCRSADAQELNHVSW